MLKHLAWPFKDSPTAPNRWQYLAGLSQGSPEGCICSEFISIYYTVLFFPQPVFTGPGIKKWKRKWYHILVLLGIHQQNSSIPSWLAWRSWVPGENVSTRWHSNESIELEVKTATQPLGFITLNQLAKEGITILVRMNDPNNQWGIVLLLHNGSKEEIFWEYRIFLMASLSITVPLVIKVNG